MGQVNNINDLQIRHETCIRYANTMMTMIKLLSKQDDRQDEIRSMAKTGRDCLLIAKEIEAILEDDKTIELNIAA